MTRSTTVGVTGSGHPHLHAQSPAGTEGRGPTPADTHDGRPSPGTDGRRPIHSTEGRGPTPAGTDGRGPTGGTEGRISSATTPGTTGAGTAGAEATEAGTAEAGTAEAGTTKAGTTKAVTNDDAGAGASTGAVTSAGALARCIDIPAERFAAEYWGRAPRLARAANGRTFRDLLDERAVDELVSERGLRTPFLRMAKGGNVLPGHRFTRSGGSGATIADQVADDKVLAQLADGATLVLQALHRTWPPLVRFGSTLAAELGHPAQINAYITPPQNQGFAAHYDTHDVFVLQVSGRKRWRIHEPVLIDPLPEQNWETVRDQVAARAAEEPLIDTVLEPGDALYLPRGYLHSAVALGDLTIHLTVGVHPVSRNSLLRQLLAVAADDANLRACLPMGVDLADPAVLASHVAATARALAEFAQALTPAQSDAVALGVGVTLAENTRPEPIGPLAQGAAAAGLTARTPLRVRAGLRYAFSIEAETVVLRVLDKTVTMPAAVDTALTAVLRGAGFTPSDLPGLDPDGQLDLARRLLREGIVVPARAAVPAHGPDPAQAVDPTQEIGPAQAAGPARPVRPAHAAVHPAQSPTA